jgi:hypothetical protein
MVAETKAPIGGKGASLGAYQARPASRRQLSGRDILIESHFNPRMSLGSHSSRGLCTKGSQQSLADSREQ